MSPLETVAAKVNHPNSADWHGARLLAQRVADMGHTGIVAARFHNSATGQVMTYTVHLADTPGDTAEEALEYLGVEEEEELILGGHLSYEVFLPGTVGGHQFHTLATPLELAPGYNM